MRRRNQNKRIFLWTLYNRRMSAVCFVWICQQSTKFEAIPVYFYNPNIRTQKSISPFQMFFLTRTRTRTNFYSEPKLKQNQKEISVKFKRIPQDYTRHYFYYSFNWRRRHFYLSFPSSFLLSKHSMFTQLAENFRGQLTCRNLLDRPIYIVYWSCVHALNWIEPLLLHCEISLFEWPATEVTS